MASTEDSRLRGFQDLRDLLGHRLEAGQVSCPFHFGSLRLEEWILLLQASHHRRRVLDFLHNTVVDGMARSDEEPGAVVSLLGDYLDLIVVPMVLQRPSLREEALQCPCKRCGNALKAIHQLERPILSLLLEAGALTFLGDCLEEVVDVMRSDVDRSDLSSAVRACECLAILGAFSRLQEETELYRVPQGVIRCFSYLLQHLSSRRAEDVHLIAVSLHVLRNVAGNYKEVMDGSAEAFRECFEGSLLAQGQGTATFGQVLPQLPEPSSREATVATGARPQLESEAAGNPQESDECQLGSEEVLAKRQEVTEVRPVSASVTAATGAPEAASGSFVRCDQRFALSSLCLQAIFQSTELLQSLPLSEEDVRRKVMVMAREARDIELSESRRRRQSFHGIRLYFLICRSSHVRRQYAMLEPSVLEEERQTVAFLLSVSRDQHCILLRAMAQDVQSWLMWQSKAFTKRRTEWSDERKRRSQKRRSPARPTHPAEEQVVEPCNPSSGSLQPVGLFTAGEAVWMAHSLLVLAIALCLVAYWNSLEHTPASQAAVAKTGHVAGYLLYWR